MYDYRCEVLRVIDGDTVELNIDLGFSCWYRSSARLKGINAPELTAPTKEAGVTSRAALINELAKGPVIAITELNKEKDKYGRCLVRLFCLGKDVNQAMLDGGFAVPYMA